MYFWLNVLHLQYIRNIEFSHAIYLLCFVACYIDAHRVCTDHMKCAEYINITSHASLHLFCQIKQYFVCERLTNMFSINISATYQTGHDINCSSVEKKSQVL